MSETIKVVIEIPAELYAYHKYGIPLAEVLADIKAEIENDSEKGLDYYDGIYRAVEIIDEHIEKENKEAPADVRPNIHAHWKETKEGFYLCSNCDCSEAWRAPFCPGCGAVMEKTGVSE